MAKTTKPKAKKTERPETYCCELCQAWEYCVTKWLRGETGETQACCSECRLYVTCPQIATKSN